MSFNWETFRAKFPALEGRTYLNTAGGGVMSRQVADAAIHYFEESVQDGDINWDLWLQRSETDRRDVAQFIGARPEATSFLQNASLGLNIVARSLGSTGQDAARGLTGNCNILAIQPEFPSCTTPFIRAGHTVTLMATDSTGYVDASMIEHALLQNSYTAFVLSSVQFANGFHADLASIGRVCRDNDVLFVVDATQSIGAFELDMVNDHIDALAFSGYKWATAGYGNAVLATGERWPHVIPPLVGWRSAKKPYDLENDRLDMLSSGIGHEMGHPPFPAIFAMGEALRLLGEPKKEEISQRIRHLTMHLRQGLKQLNVVIRSHESPKHLSGITLAECAEAARLKQKLQEKNVWVTARQGGLRISVHAYNSTDDIDRFLEELNVLL